jgi:hypothetical protein
MILHQWRDTPEGLKDTIDCTWSMRYTEPAVGLWLLRHWEWGFEQYWVLGRQYATTMRIRLHRDNWRPFYLLFHRWTRQDIICDRTEARFDPSRYERFDPATAPLTPPPGKLMGPADRSALKGLVAIDDAPGILRVYAEPSLLEDLPGIQFSPALAVCYVGYRLEDATRISHRFHHWFSLTCNRITLTPRRRADLLRRFSYGRERCSPGADHHEDPRQRASLSGGSR